MFLLPQRKIRCATTSFFGVGGSGRRPLEFLVNCKNYALASARALFFRSLERCYGAPDLTFPHRQSAIIVNILSIKVTFFIIFFRHFFSFCFFDVFASILKIMLSPRREHHFFRVRGASEAPRWPSGRPSGILRSTYAPGLESQRPLKVLRRLTGCPDWSPRGP